MLSQFRIDPKLDENLKKIYNEDLNKKLEAFNITNGDELNNLHKEISDPS